MNIIDGFMPHGHCYLWRPDILWMHVLSDAFIFLAYVTISLTLLLLLRKRPDIPSRWTFVMFGSFIFMCGITHLVAIFTVWHPHYLFSGIIKSITAAVSIATAVLVVPILPKAFSWLTSDEEEDIKRDV